MPVSPDGAFEYTSYSGYKGAMYKEWDHEDAETRGKKESKYHGLRKYFCPHGDYTWSAVLYPPPGQVGRVERHFPWSSLRSPLIITHKLPAEIEAALVKDLLDLWYGLSRGWSQAKLAGHDWNLRQMKLWEEPKLVQTLGRIGPEEYKKAQTRVRSLVSKWLPHVPKEVVKEAKKAAAARERAELNFNRRLDAWVKKAAAKEDARKRKRAAAKEAAAERRPRNKSKAADGASVEGTSRKRAHVQQGPGPTKNAKLVERAEASQARAERAARRKAIAKRDTKRDTRATRATRRAARSGK
ncbi:hypothetical protein N2152v2_001951 [Parachlorella kessleri]